MSRQRGREPVSSGLTGREPALSGRPQQPRPGWGHATGFIALQPASTWRQVSASLLPEAQQVINRYSWAFDERRVDALLELFTPDAVWDASVMGEVQIGPFVGRERILEWLTAFWPKQRDQRRHVFTNYIVDEFDGTSLSVYCYLQLFGSRHAASQFETAGFARFTLKRLSAELEPVNQAANGWAITHFTAGYDSPFWSMPLSDMTQELRDLFGITSITSTT